MKKNAERFYVDHIGMLTELIEHDHDTIVDLKLQVRLMEDMMTEEQMKELRELLLKCQRKTS